MNCMGYRSGGKAVKYPKNAAESQVFFVDARDLDKLPDAFNQAAGYIEDMLEEGYDVLVHCRETFHRGPAI